jgi:hypothetical protein
MENPDRLKSQVSRFFKNARKGGVTYKLTRLYDMFAHAYYGRAYSVIMFTARQGLLPELPEQPPFVEATCNRFHVEMDWLRGLLSQDLNNVRRPDIPVDMSTLLQRAARFAQARPLDLDARRWTDFYAWCFFGDVLVSVADELAENPELAWPTEPEFLAAACDFFQVDPMLMGSLSAVLLQSLRHIPDQTAAA